MDMLITKLSQSTVALTQEMSIRLDLGQWYRADGDCLCPVCRQPYKKHKNIAGMEWITVLCNDELIKL
jgi:hypothetical protein